VIDLSLNEVETWSAKAARGAGLSWGLAEDAGRAARRLAAAGLAFAPSILRLETDQAPAVMAARLADLPPTLPVTLSGIGDPPFLAAMLAACGGIFAVTWRGGAMLAAHRRLAPRGSAQRRTAEVLVTPLADSPGLPAAMTRALLAPAELDALERLAHRTYVPASAGSRLAGAGAGLTDND
jgi:hypothetical protein